MTKIQANFRLDKTVIDKLQAIAKSQNLSTTQIVDKALRGYLKLPQPINPKNIHLTPIFTDVGAWITTKELLHHLRLNQKSRNGKRDIQKALADLPNERWIYRGHNCWSRLN